MTHTKDYMTARELREHIGVSHMTLHRWQGNPKVGLPEPVRINGVRYYPIAEVQTWLEQARG